MPETGKKDETSLYRFSRASSDDDNLSSAQKRIIVEFYQSVEDYVHIAEKVNKDYPLHQLVKLSLQAFVLVNLVGAPALLFFFEHLPAALLVFLVNLALTVVIVPYLTRVDFRRFYNYYYPDLEKSLTQIEIDETGVHVASSSDSGFYSWGNFKAMEVGNEAFYLYMSGGRGIAVRKSAFAYHEKAAEFTEFVQQQISRTRSKEHPELSGDVPPHDAHD